MASILTETVGAVQTGHCSCDQSRGPVHWEPQRAQTEKKHSEKHGAPTSSTEAGRGELRVRDSGVERGAEGVFVGFHDVNLWTLDATNTHSITIVILALCLGFHICERCQVQGRIATFARMNVEHTWRLGRADWFVILLDTGTATSAGKVYCEQQLLSQEVLCLQLRAPLWTHPLCKEV